MEWGTSSKCVGRRTWRLCLRGSRKIGRSTRFSRRNSVGNSVDQGRAYLEVRRVEIVAVREGTKRITEGSSLTKVVLPCMFKSIIGSSSLTFSSSLLLQREGGRLERSEEYFGARYKSAFLFLPLSSSFHFLKFSFSSNRVNNLHGRICRF